MCSDAADEKDCSKGTGDSPTGLHPELRLRLRDLGLGRKTEMISGGSASSSAPAPKTGGQEKLHQSSPRPGKDPSPKAGPASGLSALRAEMARLRRGSEGTDSAETENVAASASETPSQKEVCQDEVALEARMKARLELHAKEPDRIVQVEKQAESGNAPGLSSLRAEIERMRRGADGDADTDTSAGERRQQSTRPSGYEVANGNSFEEDDSDEFDMAKAFPRDKLVDEMLLQLNDLDARNNSLKRAMEPPAAPTRSLRRQSSGAPTPKSRLKQIAETDGEIEDAEGIGDSDAPPSCSHKSQHPLEGMMLGSAGTASQHLPLGGIRRKRSRLAAGAAASPTSMSATAPSKARDCGGVSLPPLMKPSASAPGLLKGSSWGRS